ncbi:hypothetical protein ANN_03436 [Periplaneta americana]|uniref:Uncharacterized protein n=1 Tax=Periplaneta americana TaxID=6978 RepID=A0ABQ8U2J6_PERAM|nr:hypothetical protein ANN_03436 [Periplaneta americana]
MLGTSVFSARLRLQIGRGVCAGSLRCKRTVTVTKRAHTSTAYGRGNRVMAKPITFKEVQVNCFVEEFGGGEIFSSNGEFLICRLCRTQTRVWKRAFIDRHCNTKKHKASVALLEQEVNKVPSTSLSSRKSTFFRDVCEMMVGANIPFHKVENVFFKNFIEKYTAKQLPSESTLRKNYLPDCYAVVLNQIRKAVGNNKIWVSVGETTDETGRFVAHVVVGTLSPDGPGEKFLLTAEVLDKVNHASIVTLFENSMSLLWPDGVDTWIDLSRLCGLSRLYALHPALRKMIRSDGFLASLLYNHMTSGDQEIGRIPRKLGYPATLANAVRTVALGTYYNIKKKKTWPKAGEKVILIEGIQRSGSIVGRIPNTYNFVYLLSRGQTPVAKKTLTLREEHRLRVFENKLLRKIFGAKRNEVTGEWRKLHNTELHALYSSPDIIRNIKSRRLRWVGHVARMDESRNAYRMLVGRPEGKRPLAGPRRRWEDNIKMDLREVGYDDRDWINFAQDRGRWRAYVRAAMNLRFP